MGTLGDLVNQAIVRGEKGKRRKDTEVLADVPVSIRYGTGAGNFSGLSLHLVARFTGFHRTFPRNFLD